MFAVVNVHKPTGMTSHDVVQHLRRAYGLRKVGHLGTLDPMAEGVLPVCVGKATRLIEYFPSSKAYQARITLGVTTTTLDAEGVEVSRQACPHITRELVEAALAPFVGTYLQTVPLHSAVHVGGKKLYKYAQSGTTPVALPEKTVTVNQLTLEEFEPGEFPVITLTVDCESGYYVRALARDLGQALGVGGHLSGLIRTRHGLFELANSVTLEAVAQNPAAYAQNPLLYLNMPLLPLSDPSREQDLRQGKKIEPEGEHPRLRGNQFYFVTCQNQPVAVTQAVSGQLKPIKVIQLV
jgi:tRNA pseudouridine55 synthase